MCARPLQGWTSLDTIKWRDYADENLLPPPITLRQGRVVCEARRIWSQRLSMLAEVHEAHAHRHSGEPHQAESPGRQGADVS